MNKSKITSYSVLIVSLFLSIMVNLSAQNSRSKYVVSNGYQESIRLITDRNIYFSGEIIWFQALCMDKNSPETVGISSVLYIEIGTPEDGAILQKKLLLKHGMASGGIEIPKYVPSNNYYLHAYTRQIINQKSFDSELKILTIINPEKASSNQLSANKEQAVIFWPVTDKYQKKNMGFYITNESLANGVKKISVVTENDSVIANPRHFGQGLGSVQTDFNPDSPVFLKINTKSGDSIRFPIPEFKNPPPPVSINYEKEGVSLILQKHSANLAKRMVIKNVYDELMFQIDQITDKAFIPYENISTRILHVSVLDEKNKNIIDTWLLIDQDNHSEGPSIVLSDSVFFKDDSISVSIKKSDKAQFNGMLSIVTKGTLYPADLIPRFALQNKQTLGIFLNSVYTITDSMREQVTLFLALQDNEEPNSPETRELFFNGTVYTPEIREASISGIVKNPETTELLSEAEVIVTVLQDTTQVQFYETGSDGKFIFSFQKLESFKDIALVARHPDVKSPEILINQDFNTNFAYLPKLSFSRADFDLNRLNQAYINAQVQSAFQQQQLKVQNKPRISEQFGLPTHEYVLDEYINLPTMTETITEIVLPLKITGKAGEKQIWVWDDSRSIYYENPLILLDNMPLQNYDAFLKINPATIEKITVVNSSYILGNKILRGIVQFITRKGDFAGHSFSNNPVYLEYHTIDPNTLFIQPEKSLEHTPEFFNTLYWTPLIGSGRHEISLDAPDNQEDFLILVNWFTQKGINRTLKQFTVK